MELLIVIVVIGILAAITIVAYNGIQNRAKGAAATAALNQAAKKIATARVDSSTDLTCAQFNTLITGILSPPSDCIFTSNGTEYQYKPGTDGVYCITATRGDVTYSLNSNASPTNKGCKGHGVGGTPAITNLVGNPSFETDTANWTVNSGTNLLRTTVQKHSGTYSLQLTRTGTADDFISYTRTLTTGKTYVISAWIYLTGTGATSNSRYFWIYNNGGAAVINAPYDTSKINQWQRVTATMTPTNASLQIRVHPITGAPMYVDSVMITEGDTQYNYADGNSPNWDWTDTVNNSTSTGPPL